MSMLNQIDNHNAKPIDEWAERNGYWLGEANSNSAKRRRRERNSKPLILCGHGISMRIENSALVIRDGFTHYPQTQTQYRFFPGELDLPRRIVLLDGSGTLSFGVLSWLAEQEITLVRVKWSEEIAIAGFGYSIDPKKLAWQRAVQADRSERYAFARDVIRRKLVASVATLKANFKNSRLREIAIEKAQQSIRRLASERLTDVGQILAIEGECAQAYFMVWFGLELDWTGTKRRPVPSAWMTYDARSSKLTGAGPRNWKADHPINAMLNYAYAVKAAHLHIQTLADGYDPAIGMLHSARKGFAAFVYDMIEPERPKVDAIILDFIKSRSFSASDFSIRSDGVCRLSPQLARMVASLLH